MRLYTEMTSFSLPRSETKFLLLGFGDKFLMKFKIYAEQNLFYIFKLADFFIFPYIIPRKNFTVHSNENPVR